MLLSCQDRKDWMKEILRRFRNEESGQGLSEYALILALLSIGLMLILVLFRNAIGSVFRKIRDTLAAPESEGEL